MAEHTREEFDRANGTDMDSCQPRSERWKEDSNTTNKTDGKKSKRRRATIISERIATARWKGLDGWLSGLREKYSREYGRITITKGNSTFQREEGRNEKHENSGNSALSQLMWTVISFLLIYWSGVLLFLVSWSIGFFGFEDTNCGQLMVEILWFGRISFFL